MSPTAMSTKPSATSSGVRVVPVARSISAASAANFARTTSRVERLVAAGPNTFGKNAGWILPSITLASVTVSGPPRR